MKHIAVFVHNFAVEYADLIINGIYNFFKDRQDTRVYFVQTVNPHNDEAEFEYQYWASYEYLKSKTIDEVIIVSNTYSAYMTTEEISDFFRPYFSKILISTGFSLDNENTYCVVSNCDNAYKEIVSHLKNVHGCTKIGFYSANKLKNDEAISRFEAFKRALEENNLEFHPEWVVDGNFTQHGVKESLTKIYKSKKDIPYQAIICANDVMGIEVLNYFSSLGVKIPEELKIFGLDNTYHSILCTPTLATIDQDIEGIGKRAAEFGMELLEGKKLPRTLQTPMKTLYRHSCGCKDPVEEKKRDIFNGIFNRYTEFKRLTNVFDLMQGTSTIDDFVSSFKDVVKYSGFSTITIYVLPEPKAFNREDNIILSDQDKYVRLLLHIDTEKDIAEYYEESEYFYTKDQLFLDKRSEKNPGCYVFQPLFLKDIQYGYLICKVTHTDFTLNSLLLKIITSLVIQAYSYTKTLSQKTYLENQNQKLEEKNQELNVKAKTDELTGLLNRRGFMEYGQKIILFSTDLETSGIVFFADLDGLKQINDNFGHEYGDKAIKAQAKILKEAFRKTDVVGRLSGDEFGIVATGMDEKQIEEIRNKVDLLNKQYTENLKFPLPLSISLGAKIFDCDHSDLSELLKEADKNLYEQKQIHHARNKPF